MPQVEASNLVRVEGQLDRLSKNIKNIQVVVGALVAIVVAAFFAGVYFANLVAGATQVVEKVDALGARLTLAEAAVSAGTAANQSLRQEVAANFSAFRDNMVPVGDPLPSTEPLNNGGGTRPMCAPGTVVVGLQLFKDDNGQRTIWIQCAKFGDVSLN